MVSVRNWTGDGPALNLEPLTATFVAGIARPPQVRRSVRERPGRTGIIG